MGHLSSTDPRIRMRIGGAIYSIMAAEPRSMPVDGKVPRLNPRRSSQRAHAHTLIQHPNPGPRAPVPDSKLRALGRARERDHVADIAHASHQQEQPLEAEAEAGVRHRAVTAKVEVPPVVR